MPTLKLLTDNEIKEPSRWAIFNKSLLESQVPAAKFTTLTTADKVKHAAGAFYDSGYNSGDTPLSLIRSARWFDGAVGPSYHSADYNLDSYLYSGSSISLISAVLHGLIIIPFVAVFLIEYIYKKLHAERIYKLSFVHDKLKEHQQKVIKKNSRRLKMLIDTGETNVWYDGCDDKIKRVLQDILAADPEVTNKDIAVKAALQSIVNARQDKSSQMSTDDLGLCIIEHLAAKGKIAAARFLPKANLQQNATEFGFEEAPPEPTFVGDIKAFLVQTWYDIDDSKLKKALESIGAFARDFTLYYGLSFWLIKASVTAFINPAANGELSDESTGVVKYAVASLGIVLIGLHLPFALVSFIYQRYKAKPAAKNNYQLIASDEPESIQAINQKRLDNLTAAENRELNQRYFINLHTLLIQFHERCRQDKFAIVFSNIAEKLEVKKASTQAIEAEAKKHLIAARKAVCNAKKNNAWLAKRRMTSTAVTKRLKGEDSTLMGKNAAVIVAAATTFIAYFAITVLGLWFTTLLSYPMLGFALFIGVAMACRTIYITIKANKEMAAAVDQKRFEIERVVAAQNQLNPLILENKLLFLKEQAAIRSLEVILHKRYSQCQAKQQSDQAAEIRELLLQLAQTKRELPEFVTQNAITHSRFLDTLNLQEFSLYNLRKTPWTAFKKFAVRMRVAIMGAVSGSFLFRAFFLMSLVTLSAFLIANPPVALAVTIGLGLCMVGVAILKVWDYDLKGRQKAQTITLNGLPQIEENIEKKIELSKEFSLSAAANIAKINAINDDYKSKGLHPRNKQNPAVARQHWNINYSKFLALKKGTEKSVQPKIHRRSVSLPQLTL